MFDISSDRSSLRYDKVSRRVTNGVPNAKSCRVAVLLNMGKCTICFLRNVPDLRVFEALRVYLEGNN